MIGQWLAEEVYNFVEAYRQLDKPPKLKRGRAYRKPRMITTREGKRFRVGFGK